MAPRSSTKLWIVWGIGTVLVSTVLAAGLLTTRAAKHPALAEVRGVFAPGTMTSGHHQIELACETCHTNPLGGREVLQQACARCHGADLAAADDKHPLSKFTDPRNAELLSRLDARECVTCHVEHQPRLTLAMGVTQPADFCWHCHQDVATERPSHKDMKFDTCSSSGCHRFHDNRALYEDFLLKHANEKQSHGRMRAAMTNFLEVAALLPSYPSKEYPLKKLSAAQIDAPTESIDQDIHDSWLASAHGRNGVNCSGCHQPKQAPTKQTAGSTALASAWTDHPDQQVCSACHSLQANSFFAGKHGMRLKEELTPMQPADGLLKFKSAAAHREVGCTSCHAAHSSDTQFAAVRACLRCHDDGHSQQFESSPHAELWRRELTKKAAPGQGVTCATCHMPKTEHNYEELELRQIYVQHNQSDTLRPNEKMIRPVCANCHGLAFSIDALADPALIANNFKGQPARHIRSIDMALARTYELERSKKTRNDAGEERTKTRR